MKVSFETKGGGIRPHPVQWNMHNWLNLKTTIGSDLCTELFYILFAKDCMGVVDLDHVQVCCYLISTGEHFSSDLLFLNSEKYLSGQRCRTQAGVKTEEKER